MAKLKVGDRVKILTSNPWGSCLKKGRVLPVVSVEEGCAILRSGWAVPDSADEFGDMARLLPRKKSRRKSK